MDAARAMWGGLLAVIAAGALALPAAGAGGSAPPPCAAPHWLGSWAASPSNAANPVDPSLTLEYRPVEQTFRMIVTPHWGGSTLRVHISNRDGGAPLPVGDVAVALAGAGSAVVPGSTRRVTFGGGEAVTVPSGADAVSDPVALGFAPFQRLAVSIYTPGGGAVATEHSFARETSYLTPSGSGDQVLSDSGQQFTETTTNWYLLDGIDVLAPSRDGAVVAFGDSITDGYEGVLAPTIENSEGIDADGRYPDDLQRRLAAAGRPLSVLDAGVGGEELGSGGLGRLGLDVTGVPGVTDAIVLEGINDIGHGASGGDVIGALQTAVQELHAAGIRVLLGTLPPAGGTIVTSYGDARAEAARAQVNAWIRAGGVADGTVDFDAALRDPQDPSRLSPPLDSGDHLHPSLAGYAAMAQAVDLAALADPACATRAATVGGAGRCPRAQTVTVALPPALRSRVRRAVVLAAGRQVAILDARHRRARVRLPPRAGEVRIVARMLDGRTLRLVRRYRAC
jgi:lysophospholipase L1-like esterase